ncbi:MAG: hypothetical protein ACO2ZM_04705 [Francisellaceae bacterium]
MDNNKHVEIVEQVKRLLAMGMPLSVIAKMMSLPIKEIEHLADRSMTSK